MLLKRIQKLELLILLLLSSLFLLLLPLTCKGDFLIQKENGDYQKIDLENIPLGVEVKVIRIDTKPEEPLPEPKPEPPTTPDKWGLRKVAQERVSFVTDPEKSHNSARVAGIYKAVSMKVQDGTIDLKNLSKIIDLAFLQLIPDDTVRKSWEDEWRNHVDSKWSEAKFMSSDTDNIVLGLNHISEGVKSTIPEGSKAELNFLEILKLIIQIISILLGEDL